MAFEALRTLSYTRPLLQPFRKRSTPTPPSIHHCIFLSSLSVTLLKMSNVEAVIPSKKADIVVQATNIPQPGEGEVVVRVAASAVSPLERKIQQFAFMPIPYPANLGLSFAGSVESVGPGVRRLLKGDMVAVAREVPKLGDRTTGGHQRFARANVDSVAKLRSNANLAQAAAMGGNLVTAVAAFNIRSGLDRPSEKPNPDNKSKKVLVYGGSSQLGGLAIQYVKQAGYSVVTTSSPRNRDAVADLKPNDIVDHTAGEEAVVAELVSHGPYHTVFDSIGKPQAHSVLGKVLLENKKSGGTSIAYTTGMANDVPDGVQIIFESFPGLLQGPKETEELRRWFFEQYWPAAMSGGPFELANTTLEQVPKGLHGLQGALDRIFSISGAKLIVDPWE